MATVALRLLQSVDLNVSPSIALLTLTYGDLQTSARSIDVAGIVRGVTAVDITVSSSADSKTVNAQCTPSGHFSASVTLTVSGPLDFAILDAKDSQPAAGSAAAFDRCVAQLGEPAEISLPGPSVANFDANRLAYLAGTPDRMISSSTFVRMHPPYPLWPRMAVGNVFYWSGGKIQLIGIDSFKGFDKENRKLAAEVEKGNLTLDEYYGEAQKSLAKMVNDRANRLDKKTTEAVKGAIATKLATLQKTKTVGSSAAKNKSVATPSHGTQVVLVYAGE
jgi:hypothetical protein